jgi:hypothetical protein
VLTRVSIGNFKPVVTRWPPGTTSILTGVGSLYSPIATDVFAASDNALDVPVSTVSPCVAAAAKIESRAWYTSRREPSAGPYEAAVQCGSLCPRPNIRCLVAFRQAV